VRHLRAQSELRELQLRRSGRSANRDREDSVRGWVWFAL
jgi:hypothetical protein